MVVAWAAGMAGVVVGVMRTSVKARVRPSLVMGAVGRVGARAAVRARAVAVSAAAMRAWPDRAPPSRARVGDQGRRRVVWTGEVSSTVRLRVWIQGAKLAWRTSVRSAGVRG